MKRRLSILFLLHAASLPAFGQEHADVLAKQLANPVASLVSVPLQYNVDFGYEPDDGVRQLINVQPVIPHSLSEDWNLITRVIVPVVYQDDVIPNSSQFGLGDTTPSFFFSRKQPTARGWILAFGPVFLLPTATDSLLGTKKWGAGPTALALRQTEGGWTYGALVNHLWSFAGDEDRNDISSTFVQPFLAHQFAGGRTLTLNVESNYDWKGKQWTVPVNLVYSKVTKIGNQMVSFAGGVRGYADAPDGGPDWGLRFAVTLLYPEH